MTMYQTHLINTQSPEFRRFLQALALLVLAAMLLALPTLSHAEGFNGNFGPDKTMVTNTTDSMKGWWKAIAGWGLWLAGGAFLVSVCLMGGKWWWIPIAVILICLFGEKVITQVATWSSLNSTT